MESDSCNICNMILAPSNITWQSCHISAEYYADILPLLGWCYLSRFWIHLYLFLFYVVHVFLSLHWAEMYFTSVWKWRYGSFWVNEFIWFDAFFFVAKNNQKNTMWLRRYPPYRTLFFEMTLKSHLPYHIRTFIWSNVKPDVLLSLPFICHWMVN